MSSSGVHKSFDSDLCGKTILVLGAETERKQYIWDVAKEIGIKIVLVDYDEKGYINRHAFYFIHYDYTDHNIDETHADNIIKNLQTKGIQLDGCITFTEDLCPLTALICSKLNLNGSGVEGAKIAKSKYATHDILLKGTINSGSMTESQCYAAKVYRINTEKDVTAAVEEVGLPAILKYEYGAGSFYVKRVESVEECKTKFLEFQSKYGKTDDIDMIAYLSLGYESSLVLMEYLDGTQHNIHLIMYKEEMVMAFVSDIGPPRTGVCFRMTSESTPTSLPKSQKENVIKCAFKSCKTIGLTDGVFNVEIKMTSSGPKLLEINARMPGITARELVLTYYGVDLLRCAFLICCGIKPVLSHVSHMGGHMMGIMCFSDLHKKVFENTKTTEYLNDLSQKGIVKVIPIEMSSTNENSGDAVDMQYCSITVIERDLTSAKTTLTKICKDLNIGSADYPVDYMLSHFNE